MQNLSECPQRAKNIASRIVENEAVVVVPEEGLVRILNEVGARIWQLLDGNNSITTIANIISQEFNVSAAQAEQDSLDFIRQLQQKQMAT